MSNPTINSKSDLLVAQATVAVVNGTYVAKTYAEIYATKGLNKLNNFLEDLKHKAELAKEIAKQVK